MTYLFLQREIEATFPVSPLQRDFPEGLLAQPFYGWGNCSSFSLSPVPRGFPEGLVFPISRFIAGRS